MSFMKNLEEETNVSVTENGALGYKTTGKDLLDFNFKVASYRGEKESKILLDFKKAWNENNELALKELFYIRDAREGVGERRLFRICIKSIVEYLDFDDNRVFNWIKEYGRLDDLFVFFDTELEQDMLEYVKDLLTDDLLALKENKPCSLMAKWMPSINTSSRETRQLANRFINYLAISQKEYRKMLARLRSYIDVLEKKLCANKWSEVDYETVPSQANIKYLGAFLRHDEERRRAYLGALKKGEVKINSSVLFPHDIVNKYSQNNAWYYRSLQPEDIALEAMWKGLPNYVKEAQNVLVVRDGSGSMTGGIPRSSVSALDVATALSIYFSERCGGEFKDKFITFSSKPEFVDLHNLNSLHDKLAECYKYSDCSNTDLAKTFDLVLKVAVKNNLKQEEIPTLLIISDMEFDYAHNTTTSDAKLFKIIADKYAQYGYELPKLVFWNVNSRSETIPVKSNENGVILVSGFSTPITKMVLSNKTDPYDALVEQLMSERYKQVTLQK